MELKTIFANLNKDIPGKEISSSLSPNPAKKNTGTPLYKNKDPLPPLRANVNNVVSSINQIKSLKNINNTEDKNIYDKRISFPLPNGVKKLDDVISVISKNKFGTQEKIKEEIKKVIGDNTDITGCLTPNNKQDEKKPVKYKEIVGDKTKISSSLHSDKEISDNNTANKIIYTKKNINNNIKYFNELNGIQEVNEDINIIAAKKIKKGGDVSNAITMHKGNNNNTNAEETKITIPINSNKDNTGVSAIRINGENKRDDIKNIVPVKPLIKDRKETSEDITPTAPNGNINSVGSALSDSKKEEVKEIYNKTKLPNNADKINSPLLTGSDSIPLSYNSIPSSLVTEYSLGISAITKDKVPDTYDVNSAKKPTNIEELDKVDPSIRYLKENNYNYSDNTPVSPKNIKNMQSTLSLLSGKDQVDDNNGTYILPSASVDSSKKIVQALSSQGKTTSGKDQISGGFSAFELKPESSGTDLVKGVLKAVGESAKDAINFTEDSIGNLADSYSPKTLLNNTADSVKTLSSSMINGSVSFVTSAANILLEKAASYAKTWLANKVGLGGLKKNYSRSWAAENSITNVLGFGVKFSLTNWYESEGKDGPELWNMNASMPLGDLTPYRTFAEQLSSSNTTTISSSSRDSVATGTIGTSKMEVLSVGGYSETGTTPEYAGRYLWRLSEDIATVNNIVSMGKYDNNIDYQYGPHFKGYSDIANFEARVDRFYDFAIIAPPQLVKVGLPQAFSRPGLYINTTMKWNKNNSGTPLQYFKNDGTGIKRKRENIDIQANLNTINTIKSNSGDSYPLGYFGAEAITKHLEMIANINMTLVEDTSLSVRKWLEAYQNYMYNYNSCSGFSSVDYYNTKVDSYDKNINPLMHRPIYQGYYYIKFWYLNSMRMPLFSKIFYGVPNYDLNITPDSSGFKTFMIDWDIIGDTPIMYSSLWNINEAQQSLSSSESEDGANDVPGASN